MKSTLGDRVRDLRAWRGWKQVTLARYSGIPQATVSRIENDKVAQPELDQLQKLANALGTTIDYLVEGKEFALICPHCGAVLVLREREE